MQAQFFRLLPEGLRTSSFSLSSVKTPALCCGQTELPAAPVACQAVPSPNSGHFFGLETSSSLFHLTPHLSDSLDVFPGLDGQRTLCSHSKVEPTLLPAHHTHARQEEPRGQRSFLVLLQVPIKESANISSIIENYL